MKKILLLLLLIIGMQGADAQSVSDFQQKMNNCSWRSKDGFMYPSFMKYCGDTFVDDMTSSVERWKYGSVELCYWGLLGNWAVSDDEYPTVGQLLSTNARVKSITYRSSRNGIYSGYTRDGRIFYMKVNILYGREVDHATSLIILYPKAYQNGVMPLINVIKSWRVR